VYIGYAVGAALSFFINDSIGRLWSFRLYIMIWIVGQMVASFSPNLSGLYAARIISGIGIGSLTVTGPMSIVEIAPTEIRGLLGAWFVVAMGMSLFVSIFCVYGVYVHVPVSRLQYQTVFFAPCIFMLLLIIASFFLCESPRWLLMVGRRDEGIRTLVKLRGLPSDNSRVALEIKNIEDSINKSGAGSIDDGPPSFIDIVKETFAVPSNLRRLQQVLISYALAQLSGANSITSYFVPILKIMGLGGNTTRSLFLSGMYCMSKLFFCLIASFFFIDALGRRKSLFVGITLQMISDIYVSVYVKYKQQGSANFASSEAAIAAIFIHAFGYSVGMSEAFLILSLCLLANHIFNKKGSSFFPISSVLNSGPILSAPSVVPWEPRFTGCSSTVFNTACHRSLKRPIIGVLFFSSLAGALFRSSTCI
jgi:MFS family permease